jgi:DNA replication protein DnaC
MSDAFEIRTFRGTCLRCGEAFDYTAPAFALGETYRPVSGPAVVCQRAECIAAAEQELADAIAERGALDARDIEIRARKHYAEQVPDLYHVAAEPGHSALPEHVLPELRSWKPGQSLYLSGPSGSGKSHQLAALMHLAAGRTTMEWHSTRRLIADSQASISSKTIERPSIFGAPTRSRVLVLNDLFAEKPTQYSVTEIGNLIDARYDAGMSIVASSNLTLAEARALSDDPGVAQELIRITDRLLQMTSYPRGLRLHMDSFAWRSAIARSANTQKEA